MSVYDYHEIPWRVCDLGEQPWDGETPFCCETCAGALILLATVCAAGATLGRLGYGPWARR